VAGGTIAADLGVTRDAAERDIVAALLAQRAGAEHSAAAEDCWQFVAKFVQLDLEKGKEGNDLDEFNAHRFLEFWKETQTIVGLRELLQGLGLDRKKRMSLIEYLLCKYKENVKVLMSRPQGTNEDLVKAQKALQHVQDEIDKIEKKKAELEKASEVGGVKGNAAKNELQQLCNSDNTDLNRAVLSAEAAVRKAQKMGGATAQGALWWVDRELAEMKKYKPQKKQ